MGKSNNIMTSTLARSHYDDGYDLESVLTIAARCIVTTHSALLDAVRRAHMADNPHVDPNVPRLYPIIDPELMPVGFAWERRYPASHDGAARRIDEALRDEDEFQLAPDEDDDETHSEELLRNFADEFEIQTILEIEGDLSSFRDFCKKFE